MSDPPNREVRPAFLLLLGCGVLGLSLAVGAPAISSETLQGRGWRLEGTPAVIAGVAVLVIGSGVGLSAFVAAVRQARTRRRHRPEAGPSEGERSDVS
jgi:hypothetical protein